MNKSLTFLISLFLGFNLFGQSAEELNESSKKLIEQKKFQEAIPILQEAAELGNAESQYNLGYCYQAGIGIEPNIEKAIELYSKSAEQGFNDALYQMMMAYGNGNGVQQDFEKAFSYALQCANNDDTTCMFNVINCYKQGMGVEKDLNKMLEWAIKLGKLENPVDLTKSGNITSARLNLAYMFRDGVDVEKDFFKSYQWFLIYNENKKDFSYIQQQQIVSEIQNLEKELTQEQKESAVKETQILLERELKNLGNLYKAEM